MNTVEEVFKECRIKDNIVFLPDEQLDSKLYLKFAENLNSIGGKWNKKAKGFVFEHDPSELLGRIKDGEKVNLKKEFQFFETPDEYCKIMVDLCHFESGMQVLEPSAGKGAILKELPHDLKVTAIELNSLCIPFLVERFPRITIIQGDFLQMGLPKNSFDRVIANPPFSKNQDIDHIEKMYELCKTGGKVVTVASKHWKICSNQKELRFRNWIESLDSEIIPLDAGVFKQSGTMIESVIIIIDK